MDTFQKCDCIYCKEHGDFPILWKLSPEILWFEIPKNGSSSIKQKYKNREHIVDYSSYNDKTPYVILRDPVDRFMSLFKHYFLKEGRRFFRGKSFYKKLNKNIEDVDILERLDILVNNLDKLSTEDEVHHFYPQTYFIDTKKFNNFNLVNIKNLSKMLNIPISNHTVVDVDIQLNHEQLQYIKNIYKDDYEFLNKEI